MSRIDAAAIEGSLSDASASDVDQLEVFDEIDSTNSYLLREPPPTLGRYRVAIAAHQTAGRGRQGREWLSSLDGSLCLSMAHMYDETPDNLPALTLAAGVGIVNALGRLGVGEVKLKWPNDIVLHDAKLGGMLTETQFVGDRVTVVIGVGLNIDLPEALCESVSSNWAQGAIDLKSVNASPPSREALSAAIVDEMIGVLSTYVRKGFTGFADEWAKHDWLLGRVMSADGPGGVVSGIADGVNAKGALRVRTADGVQHINSGSITVEIPTDLAG